MTKRWGLVSIPLLVAVLYFYGCGESGDSNTPTADVESLSSQGPYGIGYFSLPVTYKTPIANEDRTVQALVWYPTMETEGERPIYGVVSSDVAVKDAAPASFAKKPTILFSHGHQAYPGVMSYLMEHWASHGYVVIAPGHTGNTVINGDDRETDIYYLRALDLKAAFEYFLEDTSGPLAGMLGEQIVVTGHSFGGYTAFGFAGASFALDSLKAECELPDSKNDFCSTLTPEKESIFRAGLKDSRVIAAMSFDPGNFDMYGTEGISKIDVPVLHAVAGDGNHADPDPKQDKFWQALSNPQDVRLLLVDGGHNDFVDSCGAGIDIRCSDLTPELVWKAMRVYTFAFLRQHLDEDQSVIPILTGEVNVWEQMTVQTRN